MKRDLYSNGWISAKNQSPEIYPQAYREEIFFIVSLKILFKNLNLVKSYDTTNPTVFAFSLWKKYRWGLTSFGQYISKTLYSMWIIGKRVNSQHPQSQSGLTVILVTRC